MQKRSSTQNLVKDTPNSCEATFTVFPKFRPKDTYLQALHYCASMNIQSSVTYLCGKRGSEYHWILDLFQRMGLPILDGMKQHVCTCSNIAVECIHFTGIQHVSTMPNCYVFVVFERQPNPDEAVEAKGGKKASKNRAQVAFRGTKRYMYIRYLSLSVITIS